MPFHAIPFRSITFPDQVQTIPPKKMWVTVGKNLEFMENRVVNKGGGKGGGSGDGGNKNHTVITTCYTFRSDARQGAEKVVNDFLQVFLLLVVLW